MKPQQRIERIIRILQDYFKKHRHPTLRRSHKENNPFKTLISCLLSLRTQDKNTEIASRNLFSVADTPKKISELPLKKLEKLIYSSGYYKNKAKTISHVSKVIIKKYNGKVPEDINELMSIKGVGRKTAAITMVFGFGRRDFIPVDTHCHRIPNRLGWVETKTPEQTEQELMKIIPKKYWFELNTLFVLFGKEICITLSPKCSQCPVKKYCPRIGVIKSR